jgi:predicted nucleic acid-binding Zn ribbon protein
MNTCRLDGCASPSIARGLCSRDYQRIKSEGRLDEVAPKVFPPCARCRKQIPSSRRYGAKFCSVECKDAEADARKHQAVAARRATRRIECAWCSRGIDQVRADQRFCSGRCADAWRNEQTRLRTLREKKSVSRKCELCGELIPPARSMQAVYCSPECKASASVLSNPKRRRTTREYNRRYLYGLTPEQYEAMLAEQEGRCAICRTDDAGGKGGWHVDHDHATGSVRALLCHHCNLGLGNFRDDPVQLRSAADYLDRFAVKS